MSSTIRIIGEVNQEHCLVASVPEAIPPGKVEVLIVLAPNTEDDAGQQWMAGVAHEWNDDLADPQQDIYTLADGVPVDASR